MTPWKLAALACAAPLLVACGTTHVGMTYAPTAAVQKTASGNIQVGRFSDDRGEPSNWLGAIRGGFGNPLKNLETATPVNKLVETAFAEALRARGYAVPGTGARRSVVGSIKRLECNQVIQREADAKIEFRVVDSATGAVLYQRTHTARRAEVSLLSSGVFASVEDLRLMSEATLREVIDKALDDPGLRTALGS